MAMKEKHDYFEKNLRGRKTSKTVYGHAYVSMVEVRIPRVAALFFFKKNIFGGDGRSHLGTHFRSREHLRFTKSWRELRASET